MPKVSIYITTYNYGKYLKKAIDSVIKQNFNDWELIIVDDGSTDNTHIVLQEYKTHSKIKIIHQNNMGLPISCNNAIKASSGEYIIRLDADDYFDENAIIVLSNILDSHPKVGLVYPDYYVISDDETIIEQVRRKKIKDDVKLLDLPAHGAGTMIRKKCFKEVGWYREDIKCQDGYDLWIKILDKFEVYNVNLPLFYYRKHTANITNNVEKILNTRRYIKKSFVENKFKDRFPKVLGIIPIRCLSSFHGQLALKKLAGKPLISYTIEEALKAKVLDRVVITSEDPKITEFSEKYGIEFINRPISLGKPNTPIEPTITHVLNQLKKKNYYPDIVTILHVNAPLKKENHITEAINTLLIFKTDSVISVCEDKNMHYNHGMNGLVPIFKRRELRLEIDELYEENRAIYVSRIEAISDENFLGNSIGHIVMSKEYSILINSEFEFRLAEHIINHQIGDKYE